MLLIIILCFSGKSSGKSDGQEGGEIDQQPGAEAANQMEIQVAISSQAMEVELNIPELSQTEMEARRRAVTMVEVDNPLVAPLDDWATPTEDELPRGTLDMFGATGLLPDVLPDELASVLHEEVDLSAMVPPPPVRPTSASDPNVEITPTVQEEKKKRSPRQPAEDIANPGDIEDIIPPDIVVEPPVVDEEVPVQKKRKSSRIADLSMEEAQPGENLKDNAIIQPPAAAEEGELPVSFELPEVTSKPPKKKKRKMSRLPVDETTQLPTAVIKGQMEDPGDLLREMDYPPSSRIRAMRKLSDLSGPGRALKGVLAAFWQEEVTATRRFSEENFDWPEVAVLEEELPVDLLDVPPFQDVSDIRAAVGAGETVGEANLSQADTDQPSAVTKDILQNLELPPEVQPQDQDGDFLAGHSVQDLPVFPDVATSPQRDLQQDDGPAPPLSPLLTDQLDLFTRPDDLVESSSVLAQIQAMLEPGQTRDFHSLVESGAPTQPTRREAAKMFRSLLVLEKTEHVRMDQEEKEEEGFYAPITVTRI